MALNADTGKLAWHFQFTPHDVHDWDSTQVPVLADLTIAGQPRKTMLFANRNGFFYVLDRTNVKMILAKPFIAQNWAKGISPEGRPILVPSTNPSEEGSAKTCPDLGGGTNQYSPMRWVNLFFGTILVLAWVQFRAPVVVLGRCPIDNRLSCAK